MGLATVLGLLQGCYTCGAEVGRGCWKLLVFAGVMCPSMCAAAWREVVGGSRGSATAGRLCEKAWQAPCLVKHREGPCLCA